MKYYIDRELFRLYGRLMSKYVLKYRCIYLKDNGFIEKNYGNLILEIVLCIFWSSGCFLKKKKSKVL